MKGAKNQSRYQRRRSGSSCSYTAPKKLKVLHSGEDMRGEARGIFEGREEGERGAGVGGYKPCMAIDRRDRKLTFCYACECAYSRRWWMCLLKRRQDRQERVGVHWMFSRLWIPLEPKRLLSGGTMNVDKGGQWAALSTVKVCCRCQVRYTA